MTVFIEKAKVKFIATNSLQEFHTLQNFFKTMGLNVDPEDYDVSTDCGWVLDQEEFEIVENGLQCFGFDIKYVFHDFSMGRAFTGWIRQHCGVEIITRERYNGWKEMKELEGK